MARVTTQGPRQTADLPFSHKVADYGIDTRDNAALTHYGLIWGSTGT
jgi:hypothetical protein